VPVLALTGCFSAGSPAGSPAPVGTGAQANPLACAPATTAGKFPSPPVGTQITIAQIGQAVGRPVIDAELDSPSSSVFTGFEACQYTFGNSGISETENVTLVEGTNPLDGRSALQEFADTETLQVPLSDRQCTANGCSFHFATFPGLGEAAVKGHGSEGEVIAARQGALYVEVGPGDLSEAQMVSLARLVISTLS
jgi:hypothetical protein